MVEVVVGVGFSLVVIFFFFFFSPSNIVEGFSSGSFLFLGFELSFRWFRAIVRSLFRLGLQYCSCALLALFGRVYNTTGRSLLRTLATSFLFYFLSLSFLQYLFGILFLSIPLFILPLMSPLSRSRNLNPRSKKEKIHLSSMIRTFSTYVHSHNNEILEVVNGSSDCAYPASSKAGANARCQASASLGRVYQS